MTTKVTYADNGYLQYLPLVSTTLKSHVVDLTASHTLTQVYNNSSTRDISEAHYTFPLYESCSVTDFQALVGEKTIRGVVKERAEAKAIYEAAKSAGKVTALFSQDTSEVFTTSVGNIPAGGLVVVVIKYVHELKQDIEVDGAKLVIPTVIAPKYGTGPAAAGLVFADRWRTCWDKFSRGIGDIGNAEDAGLSLSITATMSGQIRGLTSPSHPISISLGSHSGSGDTDFNPMKAHATLALASPSLTGLDKDFSLLISTNNIGEPRAFLAPHPTLKELSALMVTMVPKFALPSQGHEIIFVVDRSGSMIDKIATVRSALQIFLASLPMGLYFNICSFGSTHSFLWPRSQKYSDVSLNLAKTHVMGLDSSMGGTEILVAVRDTMKARRLDMRTEVLILTDGEIWDAENVFRFIGESSKGGDVRFFSLGVGDTVSHSLVEGISRAGRGYSQIVNVAGHLQKKVMRMLKAALTPHVNDWDIGWEGKPEKQLATLTAPAPRTAAPISLFDPDCDLDNTSFAPPSNTLTLTLPTVIQAPAIVPTLFSYSRATVYFLITNGDRPEKVSLKGSAHVASSNTICPLQIEIPVQVITSTGASLGIYQLAGRKLLQDLEEGRLSYLEGIYDKTKEPAKHAELIAKEGARVGVEFGLASKWTSFLAVAGEEQANQQFGERTDVPAKGKTQTTNSGSASSPPRETVAEGGSAGGEQANQQLEEKTDVLTKGETQTTEAGSTGSSSPQVRLSRSALGNGRAAKRVSISPKLQTQDNICQQKQPQMPGILRQLFGGGSKGLDVTYRVSGSGDIAGGASPGGPPRPSPQAVTQSSRLSGQPTGGVRTGGESLGGAPEPSNRPVQTRRKRSSVKPSPRDGEGLNLTLETSGSFSSPSRSQKLSSPTSSSSSALSPSSPRSPPTSQVFIPTSPRSATSPSCGPLPWFRACCAARGSHSATSPPLSPTPQPQACHTAQDSHPATSPSLSPAPQPQVYYVAQDPLGGVDFDPFTSGPKDCLQSPPPPVQASQWNQKGTHSLVSDLATLPQSNGMFKADRRIFDRLGLQNRGLENAHADANFVATVAVIIALEKKFPELLEEWEFMVSKAKEAVQKLYSEADREAVVLAVRAALGV